MITIIQKSELIDLLRKIAWDSRYWNDVVYWLLTCTLEGFTVEQIKEQMYSYYKRDDFTKVSDSNLFCICREIQHYSKENDILNFEYTIFYSLEFFSDYGIHTTEDLRCSLDKLLCIVDYIAQDYAMENYI